MTIRDYQPSDAEPLWQLFHDTVHSVNVRDYSPAQLAAWSPETIDLASWQAHLARNQPFVCERDGVIVGFADVQPSGLIDQFFVHADHQGNGIARQLFAAILAKARNAGIAELTSDVSLTAKGFFEAQGFTVVRQQEVTIGDQTLANFKMRLVLHNKEVDGRHKDDSRANI